MPAIRKTKRMKFVNRARNTPKQYQEMSCGRLYALHKYEEKKLGNLEYVNGIPQVKENFRCDIKNNDIKTNIFLQNKLRHLYHLRNTYQWYVSLVSSKRNSNSRFK